jgi:hypothetical protein
MKHLTYFNLLEALDEGCPICILTTKAVKKFMDDFLYQGINDFGLREEIRKGWGFCKFHGWQLSHFGDGFGQAIIYEDLTDRILNEIAKITHCGRFKKMPEVFKSQDKCIFCKVKENAERRYIAAFWSCFAHTEFKAKFRNSSGLCFNHILDVIKISGNSAQIQELLEIEREKFQTLVQELKEFIRKHDYRFKSEEFKEEKDVWLRAIRKLAGEREF